MLSRPTKGSEMKRLSLGDSGAEVSALCLGCMYFGTRVDEQTAFRLLDRYFEAGGRFLDTSNNYAFWVDGGEGGESESLLGRWLEQRGNRDEVFLATKVGANPSPTRMSPCSRIRRSWAARSREPTVRCPRSMRDRTPTPA